MTSISDETLVTRFPDTRLDYDNKHYYAGWLEKRFLVNCCNGCGHYHHPPKPLCPKCWSFELTPTEISGDGTVHLHIDLHQGAPAPDVDYSEPHPVVTVEFDIQKGLRHTSTMIGCSLSDIRIGVPVRLTWIERYGAPYPVFEPNQGDS